MSGEEEVEVEAEEVAAGAEETQAEEAARSLTEEEIAMLEQQMRDLKVEDLLTQSVVSILNLTARRIGKEDEIDLDQAQTGIEAVRALLPLLPEEVAKEIREPLSQVQMLYASRSGGEGAPEGPEGEGGAGGETPEDSGEPAPSEPKGEGRPDSGLWTPPGS
ncbi:MAG: hypothetical protein ACKOB2_06985 [Solirubrobacterales bacterium]